MNLLGKTAAFVRKRPLLSAALLLVLYGGSYGISLYRRRAEPYARAHAIFAPLEFVRKLLNFKPGDSNDLSAVPVHLIKIEKKLITPRLASVGVIEQFEKVEINAKTPGRIENFFVKEGQLVRKGQKLVQLERYFLELELAQQRAAREAAQSELQLSQEKYENARRAAESRMKEIEKQETLLKKLRAEMDKMRSTYEGKQVLYSEGGVSKEEFETIRTELISREAAYRMAQKDLEIISVGFRDEDLKNKGFEIPADAAAKRKLLIDINTAIPLAEVEVARSRVRSAEAQMKTTEAFLKEATITSPVNGMVATRNKSVGEQVTGGSVSTAAQAIMVVVDIDPVYAVMSIKESDVKDVKKGMNMVFTSDVYEKETFNGRIEIIHPVVDPKTHTLEVKALVRNPGFRLRPGMFIRATITSGEAREMILIPAAAVVPGEGENASVFVIRQNVCYSQPVKLGRQIENMVEITEGLKPGELLAADNVSQLREGLKVREVKDEEQKAQ